MKFNFYKNPIKKEINDLVNIILNEDWEKKISKTKIESPGILDSKEIILEFLEYNEYGCAYKHLEL